MSHKYINFCIEITNLPSIRSTQFRRKFLLIHDTASHTPELSRKHVVRLWSAVQPARIHRFYINVGRLRWNETNERNKFSVPSLATRNTLNRDERVENEKLSSPLSLSLSLSVFVRRCFELNGETQHAYFRSQFARQNSSWCTWPVA